MSQSKKVTVIIVLALVFSSLSLGVSYSSLNTINNENGVATVQEKKFDVQLEGLKNIDVNDKGLYIQEPEIESNKLSFGITLKEKDAYGSCSFNVVNKGNIGAMVKEIKVTGLEDYMDYITYNVDGIRVGDIIEAHTDPIMVNVSINYNNPKQISTGGYYTEIGTYEETFVIEELNLNNIGLEIIFE